MKTPGKLKASMLMVGISISCLGAAGPNPQLMWASYYGSNDMDVAEAVTVAPDGSIFIVGFTLDFATFSIDAFVAQFSADGTTLLNEALIAGSGVDGAFGVSVDEAGIITVVGQTDSTNFPVTDDALQDTLAGSADGYVIQLNADFELIYGTYLGGSGEESIADMTVDKKGGIIVCGYTESEDFPVTGNAFQMYNAGGFDAFASRIVPGGAEQLAYSTYLGGSGDDCDGVVQDERLLRQAVTVMPNGNIVVAGMTWSDDFPVTEGALQMEHSAYSSNYADNADMYITVLDPDGDYPVVYSTLLGGTGRDAAEDLAVRDASKVSLVGLSRSDNFPVTDNAYQGELLGFQDAVVVQINTDPDFPPEDQLRYSSYLGGEGRDAGNGIYMLRSGDIVVSGVAGSTDFPTTDGSTLQGGTDIFLTRLDTSKKAEKQLVASVLFGGSGGEQLCVGPVDDGFTTVCIAGDTESSDLPGVEGSYGDTFTPGAYMDAFVAKYDLGNMGHAQSPDTP